MPSALRAVTAVTIALAISSCSKKSDPGWWCADLCFATAASCRETTAAAGADISCTKQPIAYCKLTCSATSGAPDCREVCGVDEASCDDVESMTPTRCQPMKPPKQTALFPAYSSPGWWCWRLTGPQGQVSQCLKGKEGCEWALRDTEVALGLMREAGCAPQEDDVTCFSLTMDGDLEYTCSMSSRECETVLASAKAGAPESPMSLTDFSACERWPYAAANRSRIAPRPTKHRAPGLTLVFAVNSDNPDPIRTVRMMRRRVGMRGSGDVELGDKEITVHLPGLGPENKEALVALLTSEEPWSAHRIVEARAEMEALATWATGSSAPAIEVRADSSGLPYLVAAGPEVLEGIIKTFRAASSPPDVGSPPTHRLGVARTLDGWRSYSLEHDPSFTSRDLAWVTMALDADNDRPLVVVSWNPTSREKANRVMADESAALAIFSSDRVRVVVRPTKLSSGQDAFRLEPSSGSESVAATAQATEDLAAAMRNGLPIGVTFTSASP